MADEKTKADVAESVPAAKESRLQSWASRHGSKSDQVVYEGREMTVQCLSVQQPHADLIMHYGKWCENRTWTTLHRGPLWIHASCWDSSERAAWHNAGIDIAGESPGTCQIDAIIGQVVLADVISIDELEEIRGAVADEVVSNLSEHLLGVGLTLSNFREADPEAYTECWEYVHGPQCWIFTDPIPLANPVPAKGKLGLWHHPATELTD